MIGSEYLAHEPLIISVEYMSLKDKTQVAHGINTELGEVMTIILITSSMIYLVNVDLLHKNNTMMKALLVHNKWSTR